IKLRSETASNRSGNNPDFLGGQPHDLRNVIAVHVRRLRARLNLDRVAHTACKSCLRLDICMLYKSRLVIAFDDNFRLRKDCVYMAVYNSPTHQHILLAMTVNTRRIVGESFIDCLDRRKFFPSNRKTCQIERFECRWFTYNGSNSFSSIAGLVMSKYRLVSKFRNYAITIDAGDIFRSENQQHARIFCNELVEIAELETSTIMRTANCAYSQSFRRRFI